MEDFYEQILAAMLAADRQLPAEKGRQKSVSLTFYVPLMQRLRLREIADRLKNVYGFHVQLAVVAQRLQLGLSMKLSWVKQ